MKANTVSVYPEVALKLNDFANEVANKTADFFGIPAPRLTIKNVRKGWAYAMSNKVTIPTWPAEHGPHYFTAYVVHEITHIYRYLLAKKENRSWYAERTHGPEFHASERLALKKWGLVPVYARAYVKELTYYGKPVFNRRIARQALLQPYPKACATPGPAKKQTVLQRILED